MTPHLALDFVLGGAAAWLLFKCWQQSVAIHHLRSRLMLTRPMTMAEIQHEMNVRVARFADNVATSIDRDWADDQVSGWGVPSSRKP